MKVILVSVFVLVALVLIPHSYVSRLFNLLNSSILSDFKVRNILDIPPFEGGGGLLRASQSLSPIPNTNYAYAFIDATGKKVSLILNTELKLASGEIVKNNKCDLALSGGFYSTDLGPIGQVVIDGAQLSPPSNSDLFIGYAVSADGTHAQILREPARNDAAWALQSGPIVYDDGLTRVNVNRDVSARRNLLITDTQNNIYFASIATQNNEFNGPTLRELGELVVKIAAKEKINLSQALNLDGGHHSFFKTDQVYLQETSYAGSSFCVR